MKYITKTVWVLSFVSLFTDMASEMLYPVMPVYLKSIGFSFVLIGILEGLAEAAAGLSKGYFGKLSDSSGQRMPFVRAGYALSAISKPMMAVFTYPLWIFFARTTDRLGKGIRSGARDALLSSEATTNTRGRIFGFHRGMDTLGAVTGPALALIYLWQFPGDYTTLFLLAFIPGMAAILFTFFISDKSIQKKPVTSVSFFQSFRYWKDSPASYKKLVTGLLIFALVNSSDIFLLLKARESGLSDTIVIGVYIFYNLVFALFAFPAGIVADKVGLKKTLIGGLTLFAIVYFGMSTDLNRNMLIALFFLYGIYAATSEGIAKALICNLVRDNETATAVGTYSGFQSICALFASSLAGLTWHFFGMHATFIVTGIITLCVVVYFILIRIEVPSDNENIRQ